MSFSYSLVHGKLTFHKLVTENPVSHPTLNKMHSQFKFPENQPRNSTLGVTPQ